MDNPNLKIIEDNIQTYFPYFNSTLFVNQETELNLSYESSTSISQENLNDSSEIEEKLIPLNLLDLPPLDIPCIATEKIDKNENEPEKEKIRVKTEIKKYSLPKTLLDNNKNEKNESDEIKINLDAEPYIPRFHSLFLNRQKNLRIYKQKKVKERKGDWLCIKCNNLNFSFRKKCNICGTNKHSEIKCFEIGDDLLELANISLKN